jgi:hypothetical protein
MKIRFIRVVALMAVVFVLSKCTSGVLVQGSVPPGQPKKVEGTQSAKEFAPGQQKKAAGEQSAKEFAPGQAKKSTASNSQLPPGQAKKKRN